MSEALALNAQGLGSLLNATAPQPLSSLTLNAQGLGSLLSLSAPQLLNPEFSEAGESPQPLGPSVPEP